MTWVQRPPGLFITGSDTGVGKTFVGTVIVKNLMESGYRVGVYKPVASGCFTNESGTLVSDDAVALWRAAGCPRTLEDVCPNRFAAPLAPHLAAAIEGKVVEFGDLTSRLKAWSDSSDLTLVEGAGGLLSPLTAQEYVADLADALRLPLVIVIPNRIGAINQCLQTLVTAACFREGLPIAGFVLNDLSPDESDASRESNAEEICQRTEVPYLGRLRFGATVLDSQVDWYRLASANQMTDREAP